MPTSVFKDFFPKNAIASRGQDCKREDPRCGPCDHQSKGVHPTVFINEDSE